MGLVLLLICPHASGLNRHQVGASYVEGRDQGRRINRQKTGQARLRVEFRPITQGVIDAFCSATMAAHGENPGLGALTPETQPPISDGNRHQWACAMSCRERYHATCRFVP